MKYAILRCCTTPVFMGQYETSTNAILKAFGVDFVDRNGFNCCGYPLRNVNEEAYILASARNLALSASRDYDMVTFCNCCYGTLKHVNNLLGVDSSARNLANRALAKEGLEIRSPVRIHHILELLHERIGAAAVRERVQRPLEGLRVAVHYGCHLLRPQSVVEGDNPFAPTLFDELVEATGAKSIEWTAKLDCCGAPVRGINDDLSGRLMGRKVEGARKAGADILCTACSYCQLQFDRGRRMQPVGQEGEAPLPSILYTQLLGLSMGMDEAVLGLELNELDTGVIHRFLGPESVAGSNRRLEETTTEVMRP